MRLKWDAKPHDEGVDRAVLYSDGVATPWNGIVSITERASGSISTDYYMDGVRQSIVEQTGDFEATINAFTYPDAFEEFAGGDTNKRFGLSYRTPRNNGYRLHVVYNALVFPNDRTWSSTSDAVDLSSFAWDVTASPIPATTSRPSAHIILDSVGYLGLIDDVEDMLYGTETTDPRLPDLLELVELFESNSTLRIRDNGDGTWTAEGPDDMIVMNPDGSFAISALTAYPAEDGTFVVNSY